MCARTPQSCLTLCDPVGCSPPGCPVHGMLHGVGCHALLQGIFLTQGSNPGLLHCRQTPYWLSHEGSLYHSRHLEDASHGLPSAHHHPPPRHLLKSPPALPVCPVPPSPVLVTPSETCRGHSWYTALLS